MKNINSPLFLLLYNNYFLCVWKFISGWKVFLINHINTNIARMNIITSYESMMQDFAIDYLTWFISWTGNGKIDRTGFQIFGAICYRSDVPRTGYPASPTSFPVAKPSKLEPLFSFNFQACRGWKEILYIQVYISCLKYIFYACKMHCAHLEKPWPGLRIQSLRGPRYRNDHRQ